MQQSLLIRKKILTVARQNNDPESQQMARKAAKWISELEWI